MVCKFGGYLVLSFTIFLLNGCSSESKKIVQSATETPKTIAVPQIEVVETPKFQELKKEFDAAEQEVKRLEELRERLLITYTEEYPEVKKVSKELAAAKEKLKIIENALNTEREKLEYRQKNSAV